MNLLKSRRFMEEHSDAPQIIDSSSLDMGMLPPMPSPRARLSQYVLLRCTLCQVLFWRRHAAFRRWYENGCKDLYCTRACAEAHHAVKNSQPCLACGKVKRRQGSLYCSRPCALANLRATWNAKIKPRMCKFCKEPFQRTFTAQQYCTRNCADAAHSVRMRGKGNSNYKDGMSYAKFYAEMRPLVMDRDGRKCVVCSTEELPFVAIRSGQEVTRTNLHVHHINEDVNDNRPENLVTLCHKCHPRHHSGKTPLLWFGMYAKGASESMTSRWKDAVTSLQVEFSPTTVS